MIRILGFITGIWVVILIGVLSIRYLIKHKLAGYLTSLGLISIFLILHLFQGWEFFGYSQVEFTLSLMLYSFILFLPLAWLMHNACIPIWKRIWGVIRSGKVRAQTAGGAE